MSSPLVAPPFAARLEALRPRVTALLRARLPRRARGAFDVEDVWQEACAEALRAQEGFRGGTDAEFARWTTVIAVRALTAAARRALGRDFERPEAVDPDELASALARTSTGPATAAERRDAAARARAAIDALPETQRDVLALTLLRGCTHAEAAAALGRTEEAVRKAHLRALRALRARLGPEGGR